MELFDLCEELQTRSGELVSAVHWPARQLELCSDAGVFRWFVSNQYSGNAWPYEKIIDGYINLAAACLTTTFVITQRTGACKRIESSENENLKRVLLPQLAAGEIFATLGISHLTTSHQHHGKPALKATNPSKSHWTLDGFSPWVTGGKHADCIVVGAVTDAGQHVFFAVPTHLDGIGANHVYELSALSASQTGKVEFKNVKVSEEFMITHPYTPTTTKSASPNTGGLQTSALAIGLASAAVDFVGRQAESRDNLVANATALKSEIVGLRNDICQLAAGNNICSNEELRIKANSFVLRATQSALIAAKGAGFVEGHEVGRWCREALFFLVWSCPQNVSDANLCEFAGISA